LEKLCKELAALGLGQALLIYDIVEQFALGRQLQNQVHRIRFAEGIFDTQDVGVADTHEHGDFLLEASILGYVVRAGLGEHLDCVTLACRLLDA
jgi:hypothetical protein